MTREEVIDVLQEKHDECKAFYDLAAHPEEAYPGAKEYMEALQMALAALRGPTREQGLWHDAKTDPPETPGLYYGKKDDTNSMYACRYWDGVWVLDLYPQTDKRKWTLSSGQIIQPLLRSGMGHL